MEEPDALRRFAFVREAAEQDGGVVRDDGPALDPARPSDAAGFASLAGHTLTIRFAAYAPALAFLARTGATILELLEWSPLVIVVEVGQNRFSLRDGIEKAEDELREARTGDRHTSRRSCIGDGLVRAPPELSPTRCKLRQGQSAPREDSLMIRYSTQPGSPVVEITVEGSLTNKDLAEAINGVHSEFDQNGKTRVIEIIQHFTGMELAALWTDIRLGVPLAQKIDRVAIVADQRRIRELAGLGRLFTRAKLKVFPLEELAAARAWIAAD